MEKAGILGQNSRENIRHLEEQIFYKCIYLFFGQIPACLSFVVSWHCVTWTGFE